MLQEDAYNYDATIKLRIHYKIHFHNLIGMMF